MPDNSATQPEITHEGVTRRRFLLTSGAGALSFAFGTGLLAACSSSTGGNSAQASSSGGGSGKKTVTLRLGYLPTYQYSLAWIATNKGWFKSAGVDVKLTLFQSGPPALQAMTGGSIDAAILGAIPAINTIAAGALPLRILSAYDNVTGVLKIYSKKSIATVADLKGKSVATTSASNFSYVLDKVLAKYGLTQKDINFVDMSPIDAATAFVAGRVDATLPSETTQLEILGKDANAHVLFDPSSDFSNPPNPESEPEVYDLIVATESVAKQKKAALEAVLGVLYGKAYDYTHPLTSQSLNDVVAFANQGAKVGTSANLVKATFPKYGIYDKQRVKNLVASGEMLQSLKTQAAYLQSIGKLKAVPDLKSAIDPSFTASF